MKFIRKYGESRYRIVKWKKIKKGEWVQQHFGSFKNLESAQQYRDICIENNWNEKLLAKNNPFGINPLKYIHKTISGTYRILKQQNGELVHFGTFSNIIDAINERNLLASNNWDLDNVCETTDETINGVAIFTGKVME